MFPIIDSRGSLMSVKRFLSSIIVYVLLYSDNLSAQKRPDPIVIILDEYIVPIKTVDPDSSFADIGFLKVTLKDKQVIGLGEGTHGSHEFFRYKDRLIRFLVAELHFKAIAFESDFAAVQQLDEYVIGRQDRIRFLGGFPLISETKEMLAWLREYNKSLPLGEKVRLHGLEARSVANITKLLLDSLPNLSAENRKVLSKICNIPEYLLKQQDIAELQSCIPSLYSSTTKASDKLPQRYIRLLEQKTAYILQPIRKQVGMRDEAMFENAVWIKEMAAAQKLIIWAHNGHLSKENIFTQVPLGKYLSEKYGTGYFSIATDFNHGEVRVHAKHKGEYKSRPVYFGPAKSAKEYEFCFGQARYENFLLDLNEAVKNPELKSWLEGPRMMKLIGGTPTPSESKLSISRCFDLLCFFRKSTASK